MLAPLVELETASLLADRTATHLCTLARTPSRPRPRDARPPKPPSASRTTTADMSNPSVVQLKPFLQPFPYGREGMDSWAAQYALATPSLKRGIDQDGGIKPNQPYGELWCGGTHQNGPCYVEGTDEDLKSFIQRDVAFYLGDKLLADQQMSSQYPADLPFLFKILSFDKPLPLQCHPDKSLGKRVRPPFRSLTLPHTPDDSS